MLKEYTTRCSRKGKEDLLISRANQVGNHQFHRDLRSFGGFHPRAATVCTTASRTGMDRLHGVPAGYDSGYTVRDPRPACPQRDNARAARRKGNELARKMNPHTSFGEQGRPGFHLGQGRKHSCIKEREQRERGGIWREQKPVSAATPPNRLRDRPYEKGTPTTTTPAALRCACWGCADTRNGFPPNDAQRSLGVGLISESAE